MQRVAAEPYRAATQVETDVWYLAGRCGGIPAGRFVMGSAPDEPGRQADEVAHAVEITRGFYLGKYEVTQGEWTAVMGRNPSRFPGCGPRCPVETVTYDDIQELIRRLSRRSRGSRFRLPTEAECARGGLTQREPGSRAGPPARRSTRVTQIGGGGGGGASHEPR